MSSRGRGRPSKAQQQKQRNNNNSSIPPPQNAHQLTSTIGVDPRIAAAIMAGHTNNGVTGRGGRSSNNSMSSGLDMIQQQQQQQMSGMQYPPPPPQGNYQYQHLYSGAPARGATSQMMSQPMVTSNNITTSNTTSSTSNTRKPSSRAAAVAGKKKIDKLQSDSATVSHGTSNSNAKGKKDSPGYGKGPTFSSRPPRWTEYEVRVLLCC